MSLRPLRLLPLLALLGGAVFSLPAQAEGEDLLQPLVPVVPNGWLSVKILGKAPGATVFIDGAQLGPADGTPREVVAGIHQLAVKRAGFRDFEETLTIRGKATTEISVTLEAVAGLLSVEADVPGAEVLVDGALLGRAPVSGLLLPPGTHDVVVRTQDGGRDSATLLLRAGQEAVFRAHLLPHGDRPVASTLEPRAPAAAPHGPAATPSAALEATSSHPGGTSPWLWVGVGAVVAAGVVTAVVLAQPRGRPLTADEVCGGPCDGALNAPSLIHF